MEKGRDRAIHHEFGSFVRCTGIWEGLKSHHYLEKYKERNRNKKIFT